MDHTERTNYYRKKSSKAKKEIEEQITEDRKINTKLFQMYQKARLAESKGQRQHWILICQKMTALK